MKLQLLAGTLAFVLSGLFSNAAIAQASNRKAQEYAKEVFSLMNQHRETLGLPAIQYSELIAKEAQAHSQAMAAGRVPLGSGGFNARAAQIQKLMPRSQRLSECVNVGAPSPERTVSNWLESTNNKANLEGDFNFTGIGVAFSSDGKAYCTQIFAKVNDAPDNDKLGAIQTEIFELINKHRLSKGLPAMRYAKVVEQVAQGHSADMATKKVPFSHDGFENRQKQLQKAIPTLSGMAENVAYGSASAERTVNNWLNSPGHLKNIEGDYSTTGISAVASKDGVVYYTQLFVK